MISPILSAPDADTVTLDFGVFVAEHARTYRTSQSAIIAAILPVLNRTSIPASDRVESTTSKSSISADQEVLDRVLSTTPSQPEETSQAHAPAAQTDGGVSSLSLPSVEPITGAPKPLPDAPDEPADALVQPAEAKTSEQVDGGAVSAVKGANARLENAGGVEPPPSKPSRNTKRQQVIDCHKAHPDWNSFEIAEHLGYGAAHVQVIAGQCGIKLPRAPRPAPVNMRDKVLAVISAHPEWSTRQIAEEVGCSHATAARWAKDALAKPPEAEAPSSEPQSQPSPELPPLSMPSDRLPLPPPVVRPARQEPSGRFYLRDKVTGHFVHQSLQPASHGDGPMMTMDRKWAWYDTFERFKGARKRWPQIAEMRKEAVSK